MRVCNGMIADEQKNAFCVGSTYCYADEALVGGLWKPEFYEKSRTKYGSWVVKNSL